MVGTLQKDEQDLDAAARAFTARVDLVPNDPEAHRDLGRVYFLQGDDVKARAEFEIALFADPSDVDAYTSLGQIHLRQARPADAADVARRALEIRSRAPRGPIRPRHRSDSNGARGRGCGRDAGIPAAAGRGQRGARASIRIRPAATRGVGVACGRRSCNRAVTLLRRALVYEPTSAQSHLDLGLALLESGQMAEAVDRLKTAAALNASFDVHRHLAKAHAALGQTEESRQEQAIYERLKRDAISKTGRAR